MMCTLPPVKNARACDSCSVSMTTPWPAKAASPWMRMGNTREPAVSPRRSWRARTEPSTTGFTTSRCEGLNASATCTLPPGVRRSDEKPLWYFTSPEPCMMRGVVLAFEFVEQHRWRLAEHVHQHVEAAAMRHADDALFDALLHRRCWIRSSMQRNQRIAAFEREALLADVLGVQVALETLGRRQLPEDVLLFFGR